MIEMQDFIVRSSAKDRREEPVLPRKILWKEREWSVPAPKIHGSKDLTKRPVRFIQEMALTYLGIAVTLLATYFFLWDMKPLMAANLENRAFGAFALQTAFVLIFGFLIYGNLLYQLCRLFYFKRLRRHRPASKSDVETVWHDENAPFVTMLIPSYKEELKVVRQSLLSCALQEYPHRRVVLLIDNPPHPSEKEDRIALERTRELTEEIQFILDAQAGIFRSEYDAFRMRRLLYADPSVEDEAAALIDSQFRAARWFADRASREVAEDHTDRLFIELTYHLRAERELRRARSLKKEIFSLPQNSRIEKIEKEYIRLVRMFEADITSFERKMYVNLSHESNKAMNLNSYLGLMGKSWRETGIDGKEALVACAPSQATLHVPSSPFVLTLDADSLLDAEYTIRLVNIMSRPENERIGVIQTPYTAVPEPSGILEKVAGATTDMQYIIHQGFTYARAAFWVGANALIRHTALKDIAVESEERGFKVYRFIQDRTVIEDTESSVDLMHRGWSIHNFPERLSYSATPSDFGSLLIQRRRWANGGLIILPKMLAYILKKRFRPRVLAESFFRIHYLMSIAAVNMGLVVLLAYPFDRPLKIFWLPFTALSYYYLYGRDLKLAGYRWRDLFNVYALNLFLIPVNLGGVFKSIWQFFTKKKIAFSRTPKIAGQTLAPPKYFLFEILLLFYCLVSVAVDSLHGRWVNAFFTLLNGIILVYAFCAFSNFKNNAREFRNTGFRGLKQIYDSVFPAQKEVL